MDRVAGSRNWSLIGFAAARDWHRVPEVRMIQYSHSEYRPRLCSANNLSITARSVCERREMSSTMMIRGFVRASSLRTMASTK